MATTSKKAAPRTRRRKAAANTANLIECDSCLEIAQAEGLLGRVREVLEQPDAVRVKADKVETITTPCMQVLCALAVALQERGQSIAWESPSEKLQEVAGVLGVREHLGLPG